MTISNDFKWLIRIVLGIFFGLWIFYVTAPFIFGQVSIHEYVSLRLHEEQKNDEASAISYQEKLEAESTAEKLRYTVKELETKNKILDTAFAEQSSLAGSTWLRKSAYYIYEYIYDGEVVKQFDVPNRYGPSNSPMLFVNCAINLVNQSSVDEGRYFTSERVDIYCGRKDVVSITNPKETNYFNSGILESEDKDWVLFIPDNDSAVPGYGLLKSDGTLKLQSISDYAFVQSHRERRTSQNKIEFIPDMKIQNSKAIIYGSAIDPSGPDRDGRAAVLTISSDGSYVIEFQDKHQ